MTAVDLLGDPLPRSRARPTLAEAAALVEVLQALRAHSAVSWCERMNTGAARIGRRFVRFGWRGCPDILGQLRDGRVLAVEVKAPRGRLRPEQSVFLGLVRNAGGVAFVARTCKDVLRELAEPEPLKPRAKVRPQRTP